MKFRIPKMTAQIKICGITNLSDAQLSLELGADLLGFNFYPPSPRYIEPSTAAQIIAGLPDNFKSVGVFVNAGAEGIQNVLSQCPLMMVQLHGEENNQQCRQAAELGVEMIKALQVRGPADISRLDDYQVETILLDAFHEKLYGGTGHSFDWSWIRQISHQKIFLAGGITPENVIQALTVGTYGIDLCSGVEKSPGMKSPDKMKKLFEELAQFNSSQTND
ncbi:MAG: phosphoribosylanthranilate isomerase [Planctomycetes bacterium]|nr:phosphoribosylanthranilate isomerase [Planctomycetota bacterium]